MNFLDVRTDFAFNKVFANKDSKPRLISFLNSVIQFDDNRQISNVDIVDPFNVPKLKGMKNTFVDVRATLNDKTTAIIEIQMLNLDGFDKDDLYNSANNDAIHLNQSDNRGLTKPIIALNIVNYEMFADNKQLINTFKVTDKKRLTTYHDDVELIFVELAKFNKTHQQCQSEQDHWLYFFKNVSRQDSMPSDLPELVQSAYNAADEALLSTDELKQQKKKLDIISLYVDALALAQKKGQLHRAKQGATNLLALGLLSDEQIAQAMGLTLEQIAALKQH